MKYVIQKKFNRWKPVEQSSWVSQVFKRYNEEIDRNLQSYFLASKYTYKKLGESNANWTDKINTHLNANRNDEKLFPNLKNWSNSYNEFDQWVNLNTIMAISSNFETYLSSIVLLSLKSNPGILFGASQTIDGVSILKNGTYDKLNYDEIVTNITMGDWNSRLHNFQKIYGFVPQIFLDKLSILENVRKLRNQIGHSFGRDIKESRNHSIKNLIPIESVSRERMLKIKRVVWSCAKELDSYLLNEHIGNFQFLLFYHNSIPSLNMNTHPNQRAVDLKTKIGQTGVATIWKAFYKDLVAYYEAL